MMTVVHNLLPLVLLLFATSASVLAQRNTPPVNVGLIKMPYVGERNTAEQSGSPDYLEQGGIQARLEERGCRTKPSRQ
jgi:hypothetical protein